MLSMLMVTMLHAIGKSDLLLPMGEATSVNGWIAWTLEALSISAVNIFMLLSGYYLIHSEFKWKRLWEIVLQTIFYSLGAFLIYFAMGNLQSDETDVYHLLHYVFPVHMNLYWFITAYVVIYLLLPLISAGAKALTKEQLRGLIVALLIYECVFKSIFPVVFESDSKGYSVLWYVIAFLMGAYLRLHGFHFLTTSAKGWIAYFLGSLGVLLETWLLGTIIARTGHLGELERVSTNYNHLFVVIASVGIFAAFLHAKPMNEPLAKVVRAISPYALGVYLFQENLTLRYRWQDWFGLRGSTELSPLVFAIRLIGSVLAIYALGTAVDFVRSLLFSCIFRKNK